MMSTSNKLKSKGFTLLETLLAIGILSVVVAQVVSVQSAQVSVSKIAGDNIRATWAMRHMISQLQYVVDALGVKGLPKEHVELPWTGDPSYTLRLDIKDLNVEPSRMIMSAMKLAMAGAGGAKDEDEKDEGKDSLAGFKDIAAILDSKLPKDLYRSYMVTVSWKEGEKIRTLEAGGMIIDNKVIAKLISSVPTSPAPTGSPTPVPPLGPKP